MNKLDQMKTIYSEPAPLVDKMYITALGQVVRLSFAETVQEVEEIRLRAVVCVSADTLVSFHAALGQIIEQSKTKVEAPEQPKDEVLH